MKLLCDVCGGEVATVICGADEAALCAACDHRIHRANKLVFKHTRLSLLQPSAASFAPKAFSHPLCDVCKERRGFVFCQEDRAILCFECDSRIHSANHLTMKHSRFVLTGIRFSPATTAQQELNAAVVPGFSGGGDERTQDKTPALSDSVNSAGGAEMTGGEGGDGSSISDYLLKMLPGYCVEDLLVEQTVDASGYGVFYEGKHASLLPIEDAKLDVLKAAAASEGFPIWVPQVPQFSPTAAHPVARAGTLGTKHGLEDEGQGNRLLGAGLAKTGLGRCNEEELFAVPQVPEAALRAENKRQRETGGCCWREELRK